MPEMMIAVLVFGFVAAMVIWLQMVAASGAGDRLRVRLLALKEIDELERSGSALRARYLRQLPPLERMLEQVPGMETLRRLLEQGGHPGPAYRVALLSIGCAATGVALAAALGRPALAVAGLALGLLPLGKVMLDRNARMAKFEEQLPDALDLMGRALRAGNPLMDSFKFIGDEMPKPIAEDFSRTWSHVNYGVALKAALYDLIDRAPSVSLRALVTAILVQRETGGNLAEVLDRISHVLRGRARFARRLKTLTAEGRVSALILIAMPFVLAATLSITSPTYLPMLFDDPLGRKLIAAGLALMALGIFLILRIIRIRV